MILSSWVSKMRPIHCFTVPLVFHQSPPNFTGILSSIQTTKWLLNSNFWRPLTHGIQPYLCFVTSECQKSGLPLLLPLFLLPRLGLKHHRTLSMNYIYQTFNTCQPHPHCNVLLPTALELYAHFESTHNSETVHNLAFILSGSLQCMGGQEIVKE